MEKQRSVLQHYATFYVTFCKVPGCQAASRGPLELPRRWKCAPFDFPELQLHCPWELSIFKAQAAGKGKMAKKNYVRKESYVRNLSDVQANL